MDASGSNGMEAYAAGYSEGVGGHRMKKMVIVTEESVAVALCKSAECIAWRGGNVADAGTCCL